MTIQEKVDALNAGMNCIAANNPENGTMILLQIWHTHLAGIEQTRRMSAAGTIPPSMSATTPAARPLAHTFEKTDTTGRAALTGLMTRLSGLSPA